MLFNKISSRDSTLIAVNFSGIFFKIRSIANSWLKCPIFWIHSVCERRVLQSLLLSVVSDMIMMSITKMYLTKAQILNAHFKVVNFQAILLIRNIVNSCLKKNEI